MFSKHLFPSHSPPTSQSLSPSQKVPNAHLLIVLSDEGLWSHHQFGHVAVLVQDMDVVVGRDAVDALALVFL